MEQGGRRGVESVEIRGSAFVFPHTPVWIQDRYFCFSAILPGPSPAGSERVWWRTGTLFNRAGVVPVRFNTVYALNRLHPTGLEPGLSRTIPSRTGLPRPSYSIPSTRRQARRISCIAQYLC